MSSRQPRNIETRMRKVSSEPPGYVEIALDGPSLFVGWRVLYAPTAPVSATIS